MKASHDSHQSFSYHCQQKPLGSTSIASSLSAMLLIWLAVSCFARGLVTSASGIPACDIRGSNSVAFSVVKPCTTLRSPAATSGFPPAARVSSARDMVMTGHATIAASRRSNHGRRLPVPWMFTASKVQTLVHGCHPAWIPIAPARISALKRTESVHFAPQRERGRMSL